MNADSSSEPRVPTLRDKFREATTQAILAAAEETLVERGLHGAGMSEIASRAGVAVGTLYNHFKDREALLDALVADRRRELLGRVDRAIDARASEPFKAQLTAFATAVLEHFEAHQRFLRILLEEHGHTTSGHASVAQQMHDRIERIMKVGVRQGALRKDAAALYAPAFAGILKGLLYHDAKDKKRVAPQAQAAAVIRLFTEGAAPR